MFLSKQKLQKIKCIITGREKMRYSWYSCTNCYIFFGVDIFPVYEGLQTCPRCAFCDYTLFKTILPKFPGHKRR